jgi:hypothetical protein
MENPSRDPCLRQTWIEDNVHQALAEIAALRKTASRMSLDETLDARHEGHKR